MDFSCEDTDPATRAFMERTGVECRQRIGDVSVPLFTEQFGKTFVCGTGVLLQVGEKSFIITAAHTFDARRTADLPLWVTDGVVGNKLVPLGEVLIRTSKTKDPHHRTDEPFDMAVCELSRETATQIAVRKRFLRLNDVDPWDRQHPQTWYMVFGFPTALGSGDPATQSIVPAAVALATFLYCDERGPVERYDKEVGIALDFDSTNIRDDHGNPAIPPYPGGMSGCGIWRLVEAGTDAMRWSLDSVKLVALENTLKPNKVLVGTRIRYALQMIYRNHTDLRPVMEMHFGRKARNL